MPLKLDIEGYGQYELNEWAHGQLADKTNIPKRYYDAMRQAGFYDLAAANVNRWMDLQADKRLVRIADGKVRALLSDRYRVLDNYDLAMMTMERAKEHGAIIHDARLNETHMYIKLVVPEYRDYLDRVASAEGYTIERVHEDEVIPGLIVSNSEVGAAAFRVEPFLLRTVCSNGLIGEAGLYKVHLGERMEVGQVIYKDDTLRLQDQALWSKVRDIIDATFDGTVLRVIIDQLRKAKGVSIGEKPVEVLDAVVKNIGWGEEKRDQLLTYFAHEGSDLFGLVNGITRMAQDVENDDEQVRLERIAGKLLASKPEALARVVA